MDTLEVIKHTRKIAAESLFLVLKNLLDSQQPISEFVLRNKWLKEMQKHNQLYPDGWYIPPPHGMAVLFGTEEDVTRVSPKNIRPEGFWPREDVFLNTQTGIAVLYSSPVNKESYIIGDFQINIYFGTNQKIMNHFKTCYDIEKEIFEFAEAGMTLAEIATYTNTILKQKGLPNDLISSTDATGTNSGHTIPTQWSREEEELFKTGSWEDTSTLISKKRQFVNEKNKYVLKPGDAVTIEPRPINPKDNTIPMANFHTIALLKENGEKEFLTNFDALFELTGMKYML